MARPQTITDEEVLAAARAVFLDKGVTATVEEVAVRCGVGEATVFRRFPTKQALFIAAMDTGSELEWAQALEERWPAWNRSDAHDIRATLTAIATEILSTGRKMVPLILMKMSNPAMMMDRHPPARFVKALQILTEFFRTQIEAGRVNGRDPRVAARIWMGTLQHMIMSEAFMKPLDGTQADDLIEGLVDLFCALPPPRPKARKK